MDDMKETPAGFLRYSVSLVTQGAHRFYTLTMPSDVLARTCFVTTRDEDPKQGFQRVLDKARASEIAKYIDSGFGTIPSSIVLSAQPDAGLEVIGRGKTIQFKDTPRAFLVLDGQHRVYGFSLAQTPLRVPVVIYNGLNRQDESKLFIDINTKQRPVPNELLLDIKRLAEYETDVEALLSQLFDKFNERKDSPLIGLMSPASRSSGRLSRVTFNAAVKPLLQVMKDAQAESFYSALAAYLSTFMSGLRRLGVDNTIANPVVFRGTMMLFPEVAQRVKDRFGAEYTRARFEEVLKSVFENTRSNVFTKPGNSYKELHLVLERKLKSGFTL
jgi:DGQHR domain-containing protein